MLRGGNMVLILNEKQAAVGFGSLAALMHAAWSALIFSGSAQEFVDWVFGLHMVTSAIKVTAFNLTVAAMLIALTFIVGAVFGMIFAKVWNWAGKQRYF